VGPAMSRKTRFGRVDGRVVAECRRALYRWVIEGIDLELCLELALTT